MRLINVVCRRAYRKRGFDFAARGLRFCVEAMGAADPGSGFWKGGSPGWSFAGNPRQGVRLIPLSEATVP